VTESLDVADFVLIACEELGENVDDVTATTALPIAHLALLRPFEQIGGEEAFGPLAMKAAVLYSTLVRYQPLTGRGTADHRAVAFRCVAELLERNGFAIDLSAESSPEDLARLLVGVAEGIHEDEVLAQWLHENMAPKAGR
jgi:hypothetical protein